MYTVANYTSAGEWSAAAALAAVGGDRRDFVRISGSGIKRAEISQ